jgi:hypothetical protein
VVMMPEQYLRYALPALPFLAVFVAEAGAQPGRVMQAVYRTGMFAVIGVNALAVQSVLHRFDDLPTEIVYHKDSRDEFVRSIAPTVAANRIIDALEPEPVNVLYVSMPGGAELRGTAYYQNWYNPPLSNAFNRVRTKDDVGAIVAANSIRYIVLEPGFPHLRRLRQVANYCQQYGQLIAKIGEVYLYRLHPGAPYTHDATENPELADNAKGWDFRGGAAKYQAAAGYLLNPEISVYQKLKLPQLTPYQPFYFGATVNCLRPVGSVRVQILWQTGPEDFKPSSAAYYCMSQGVINIGEVFHAPKGAWKGVAGLIVEGKGAQVGVSEISIRY